MGNIATATRKEMLNGYHSLPHIETRSINSDIFASLYAAGDFNNDKENVGLFVFLGIPGIRKMITSSFFYNEADIVFAYHYALCIIEKTKEKQ